MSPKANDQGLDLESDDDFENDNVTLHASDTENKAPTSSKQSPHKKRKSESKAIDSISAPAPPAKKIKSSSNNDTKSIVLEYLQETNRPFIHLNITDNLAGRGVALKKTAVQTALEELAVEGKIVEKVSGKAKLYWPDQSQLDCLDNDAQAALDNEINALNERIKQKQQAVREAENEVRRIEAEPTDDELEQQLKEAEKLLAEKEKKLSQCKNSVSIMSTDAVDAIQFKFNTYVKEWQKRKALCMDLVDALLGESGKTVKKFFQEIGVETDEEHKVNLKDFQAIVVPVADPSKKKKAANTKSSSSKSSKSTASTKAK